MGDVASLRVRVDVDETDVSRVAEGQRVYCVAAAYPDQKFWGRVIRVARQLGHKNVQTDEPKEKVDTKIIETLVQLDPGRPPPGRAPRGCIHPNSIDPRASRRLCPNKP